MVTPTVVVVVEAQLLKKAREQRMSRATSWGRRGRDIWKNVERQVSIVELRLDSLQNGVERARTRFARGSALNQRGKECVEREALAD